jgi:hypothetical protein
MPCPVASETVLCRTRHRITTVRMLAVNINMSRLQCKMMVYILSHVQLEFHLS